MAPETKPEQPAAAGALRMSGRRPRAFGPGEGFLPRKKGALARMRPARARKIAEAAALRERRGRGQGDREEQLLAAYLGNRPLSGAAEAAPSIRGGRAGLVLISKAARKTVRRHELWLRRQFLVPHAGVWLHSVRVKPKMGGISKHGNLFVAVGIASDGRGELLAVCISNDAEDESWSRLIADLKKRGLCGTALFSGPNEPAAAAAVARYFPDAKFQGDLAQLQRDALWMVPAPAVGSLLRAFAGIRACPSGLAASAQAARLVEQLRGAGEFSAAMFLERMFPLQFSHYHCAPVPGMKLRDGNPLPRVLHEWRSWMRKNSPVADERALVLLAAARLRQVFGPSSL